MKTRYNNKRIKHNNTVGYALTQLLLLHYDNYYHHHFPHPSAAVKTTVFVHLLCNVM